MAKLQVNDKAVDLPLYNPVKVAAEAQSNDTAQRVARSRWNIPPLHAEHCSVATR